MVPAGGDVVNLNVALVSIVSLESCVIRHSKTVCQRVPDSFWIEWARHQRSKGGVQHTGQVVCGERDPRCRRENVACYAGSAPGSWRARVHQLAWKSGKIARGFRLRKDGDRAGRRW